MEKMKKEENCLSVDLFSFLVSLFLFFLFPEKSRLIFLCKVYFCSVSTWVSRRSCHFFSFLFTCQSLPAIPSTAILSTAILSTVIPSIWSVWSFYILFLVDAHTDPEECLLSSYLLLSLPWRQVLSLCFSLPGLSSSFPCKGLYPSSWSAWSSGDWR